MKVFLFFILLFSTSVFARSRSSFPQGSSEFGLNNLAIGSTDEYGSFIQVDPFYRYFLVENFSFGAEATAITNLPYERYMIGPSAAYYFNLTGSWLLGLQQAVLAGANSRYSKSYSRSGASLTYIMSSGFGIGLNYSYFQPLDSRTMKNRQQLALLLAFYF